MRLVVLTLWLLASSALGASEPPVALVTDLQGRIPGVPGILARINLGTALELAPQARLTLVFTRDGHRETATGPSTLEVLPEGCRLKSGAPTCLRVERAPAPLLLARGENLERIGGSIQRGQGTRQLSPRAFRDQPLLRFQSTLPGPYQVTVLDGGRKLWTTRTPELEVAYAGPPLEEDHDYRWEVQALGEPETYPPQASFRILSPASQEAVRQGEAVVADLVRRHPEDPTPYVLLVSLYTDHYLLDEALEATCRAFLLRPGDSGLRNLLQALTQERG